MSRISPIETIGELRQLLFDLPDDTAVEINADISITAANVVELYRSPWQGAYRVGHPPRPRSPTHRFNQGRAALDEYGATISLPSRTDVQ